MIAIWIMLLLLIGLIVINLIDCNSKPLKPVLGNRSKLKHIRLTDHELE